MELSGLADDVGGVAGLAVCGASVLQAGNFGVACGAVLGSESYGEFDVCGGVEVGGVERFQMCRGGGGLLVLHCGFSFQFRRRFGPLWFSMCPGGFRPGAVFRPLI